MKKSKKNPHIGSDYREALKKDFKNKEFMLEYRLERDRLDLARRVIPSLVKSDGMYSRLKQKYCCIVTPAKAGV